MVASVTPSPPQFMAGCNRPLKDSEDMVLFSTFGSAWTKFSSGDTEYILIPDLPIHIAIFVTGLLLFCLLSFFGWFLNLFYFFI